MIRMKRTLAIVKRIIISNDHLPINQTHVAELMLALPT
jgi:hypothetical protein